MLPVPHRPGPDGSARTARQADASGLRLPDTTPMPGNLEVVPESSGLRHFLDGRPVHAGTMLELQLPGGVWALGRYEWSFQRDDGPLLYLELSGTAATAPAALPPGAVLRWPGPHR